MEAQQNMANHMGMNNSNPIPQQNMMFTPAAASNAEKAETTMIPNSMAPAQVSFLLILLKLLVGCLCF